MLILIITSTNGAFAIQEGKVISDSATNKKVTDELNDINRNTDNFFTPVLTQEQRAKIKAASDKVKERESLMSPKGDGQMRGTLPPVKKLRLYLRDRKKPKEIAIEETVVQDQALLDCDTMEYFGDKTELHADGHVVMFFPKNNSTIKADRIVYNQVSNLIKAYDNVVLISDGKAILGDYMQIDMNEENAFMDNTATDLFQIRAKAKKGYMYGDKIIQEQGSMYISKKTMVKLRSDMFGPDLDTMYLATKDRSYMAKDSHGEKFKIRTDDLIINSKPEHDTITLKHAEIYFNEKKVGTIPSITIHTNKAQDYVEANYPEFGTTTNLGAYVGPGFVFDTPMGTNLKLIPLLNFDSGKFGFGGIAKFKSATNKTDFAYGTVRETFIVRGKQRLDDNLFLQYGSNAYMDDWFLGFRMPKYMGELIYEDYFLTPDFLGDKLDMQFKHRAAAAFVQDNEVGAGDVSKLNTDGGIGTARFKYMAEIGQTLYNFNTSRFLQSASENDVKEKDDILSAKIDMVFQGSAAVYGTGDTQMIGRVGPRLHTQYKYWMQDVGYFLSAYNDKTPLVTFDKYMYGRSNAYLRESLRVNKYLTLSWLGSVNLTNDSWNGNMFQENSFFISVGPDDVKINIGYDTVRQQSFVTMAMNIDAKGSSIEYKRMEIKNPERVGKSKNGEVNQNNSFAPSAGSDDSEVTERAEVIEIKEAI